MSQSTNSLTTESVPSPSLPFTAGTMDVLDCVIERVTFHNADNGYSVVKVAPTDARGRPTTKSGGKFGKQDDDIVTVLGHFTNPVVGESLRCWGEWTTHPQYGPQFRLQKYETLRPATATAIEKYLGSGMVKGVGPVMAKRIVAMFGDKSLDVIEHAPRRLMRVSGLGEKRIEAIQAAWEEQREVRVIMLFLQGHGVTPTFAVKIYRAYKERAIEIVEQNPYQLATDIWGIGFKTADKIAQNVGIAFDAPARLEAGLLYVLNEEMEGSGHCFLPREMLLKRASEILEASVEPIADALDVLIEQERLVDEQHRVAESADIETAIYLPSIQTTERAVAERIRALLQGTWRTPPTKAEIETILADIPNAETLSGEQRQAVRDALVEPVLVLTGGPGVGKTFTTRAIVAALERRGKRILLASPTGRAAKRLTEMTGRDAKTIHRMLVYDPEKRGFKHDASAPLECDALIVDESSMLDLMLTHYVLRALPNDAQILFVGDVDQLPSVGPGNVLSDLISSGIVPVARLTQVFRQAQKSRIITNAHAINQGRFPDLPPASETKNGADCVFVEVDEADELPGKVAGIVRVSLPRLGFSAGDITVLAPMQRGVCGAKNMNAVLQSVLNPPAPGKTELARGPITFRVGDRVMQRVNNYDKHVFNGDVGNILEMDLEDQTLLVEYPDNAVPYDFADVDQLAHAFSLTVHKSQGSEYQACIIALHTQHYMMLQRNVVYTALTRARKLAVFVGSKRALAMAIRSDAMRKRHTRLAERLQLSGRATQSKTRSVTNGSVPLPGGLL